MQLWKNGAGIITVIQVFTQLLQQVLQILERSLLLPLYFSKYVHIRWGDWSVEMFRLLKPQQSWEYKDNAHVAYIFSWTHISGLSSFFCTSQLIQCSEFSIHARKREMLYSSITSRRYPVTCFCPTTLKCTFHWIQIKAHSSLYWFTCSL